MAQTRTLVLGGKGFIGSHLIDALAGRGFAVRAFDRPNVPALSTPAGVDWAEGDFTHEADVTRALKDIDVVYHLVSTTLPQTSNADPVFDVATNVEGSLRMLQAAVKTGVKKVVFISSGGTVYGVPRAVPITEDHPTQPISSYGITKLAVEKYLHLFHTLHQLDYTVLRLSNPFGERQRIQAAQGAVAVFMGKILRGEPIEIWGDGSVVRDYIYIGDAVAAMVQAASYAGDTRVLNVGSGTGISLNDILAGLAQVTGRKPDVRYAPGRAFDVPVSVLDITRARAALDWAPVTPFTTGLEKMHSWMKADLAKTTR